MKEQLHSVTPPVRLVKQVMDISIAEQFMNRQVMVDESKELHVSQAGEAIVVHVYHQENEALIYMYKNN